MNAPPLMSRVAPVMKPVSSEARKATSAATSSGCPNRPRGMSPVPRGQYNLKSFGIQVERKGT